jgi:hypothetical protein
MQVFRKKDMVISLTFRYARIVYPIFRKEASYNLFIISLDHSILESLLVFTTDIEINISSDLFFLNIS